MTFEKFEMNSFCAGGRFYSVKKIVYGDLISEGSKVFIGHCLKCNGKKFFHC